MPTSPKSMEVAKTSKVNQLRSHAVASSSQKNRSVEVINGVNYDSSTEVSSALLGQLHRKSGYKRNPKQCQGQRTETKMLENTSG